MATQLMPKKFSARMPTRTAWATRAANEGRGGESPGADHRRFQPPQPRAQARIEEEVHLHGRNARNYRRQRRGESEGPPRTATEDTHRLPNPQPRPRGRLAGRVQLHGHQRGSVPPPLRS